MCASEQERECVWERASERERECVWVRERLIGRRAREKGMYKEKELLVVPKANAVVDEGAVVIHSPHTSAANSAVMGSSRLRQVRESPAGTYNDWGHTLTNGGEQRAQRLVGGVSSPPLPLSAMRVILSLQSLETNPGSIVTAK